ncbi:MAG: hypothetical protein WDM81_11425 [Rhizomicrobium sp.]
MLLVALLAVAALDNAVCYAEDIQTSAVTGMADKGTPANRQMPTMCASTATIIRRRSPCWAKKV